MSAFNVRGIRRGLYARGCRREGRDRIVIAGSKEYRLKRGAGATPSIFRGFLRAPPGMPVA
jgi:hypothetical protein